MLNLLKPVHALIVSGALLVSACSSIPNSAITQSNGRVILADSQIGENYDTVIARASSTFAVEPHCEERKVQLRTQRKAFVYDICGYMPEQHQFADAALAEVVYHFIGRSLVRVDVRAQGESQLFNKVKDDMQSVSAFSETKPSQLSEGSYQWVGQQQVAGVRVGGGVNKGNVHVRLLDQSLTDSAPWLAEE